MLFLLGGKLLKGKVFVDLLGELLPIGLRVVEYLHLVASFPVGVHEDGFEVGKIAVVDLPLDQQGLQRIEQYLFGLYLVFQFYLFRIRIFIYAVDDRNFLVNFSDDVPIVLRKVLEEVLA